MEQSPLARREPASQVECWDDDDDLQGISDFHFRNFSSTTAGSTHTSNQGSRHRDSISSRVSSAFEGDEEWQVLLPADDEASHRRALASAKTAGIPLPADTPPSALVGGTIKRLGGRRIKKALGDDWDEDLEIPKTEVPLRLKRHASTRFPETLRQTSTSLPPVQAPPVERNLTFLERLQASGTAANAMAELDRFRDQADSGDFGDVPTIKVAKGRVAQNVSALFESPIKPSKPRPEPENFEDDLELPAHGGPLTLSARKDIPKTPSAQIQEEYDIDWAEGSQASLGTSASGALRGRSNRSSSISAPSPSVFSPSLSSCLTAESEDEGLDGLVLPNGPLKFEEALQKRLENASPDPTDGKKVENRVMAKEDFFSGIEIGDGDVFDAGKLTLNRNIKHTQPRPASPKRAATTITFTAKASAPMTRIPKPAERSRSKLEPVSESGGPIPSYQRNPARKSLHSNQSSTTSLPTSLLPPLHLATPSTPVRRPLGSRASRDTLRSETTTSAQLLKTKRSMPALRTQPSPARSQPSYPRPPSRSEKPARSIIPRPKTPIDRSGADSSLGSAQKPPVPVLPPGNASVQSRHVASKSSRNFRPTSSDSNDSVPLNRPVSRISNSQHRPPSPTTRKGIAPESLVREAATKRQLTKPLRRRVVGEGNELVGFDDLPTSAAVESKFIKQPVPHLKATTSRSKLYTLANHSGTSIARTETPVTPLSPRKYDGNVPGFARDTNASRSAREQRIMALNPAPQRHPNSAPLAPASVNWKAHVAVKSANGARPPHKSTKKSSQKPQLIRPLGNGVSTPKTLKNMHWNPDLFRWEGNEHAVASFDAPSLHPPGSPRHGATTMTCKPALIANVGSAKGVQVVGGMVFDPQRMCWLKMAPLHARGRSEAESPHGTAAADDDDTNNDDPFAGLDDLDDGDRKSLAVDATAVKDPHSLKLDDEWLVGEEFDIGPEFKRRQRAEEERWQKKMEVWKGTRSSMLREDEGRWLLRQWMEQW